ncbi:hypothetical protein [uncultured Sunxiuqinia sp.]|uniref:hypothetical protein n=1 Tax=uncultured Sunxiuqinia sp. TaxID=1573825 RepID=UPI002AA5E793|nr:hypothetical protein [uncultured Sunxiuqinia sp.]
MKKTLTLLVFVLASTFAFNVQAQDEASSSFDTGVDIYSSYIWRGAKFGNGPAFQPYVEFSTGGFAIGAWGSVSTGGASGSAYIMNDGTDSYVEIPSAEGYEMDLYAGYDFGPVSITVTDYYFGGDWTDGDMHFFEPSLGLALGDFGFTAAYMTGDGVDDTYLEAAYSFSTFDVFLGGGDGQYTKDGDFSVCNVGIGTSKEVKLTESFSLPVSGSVILNPSTGGFFITVGLSL